MTQKAFYEPGDHHRWSITHDPLTGVQIRIGVMGSAGGGEDPAICRSCRELGEEIARKGCCLLTEACPGFPHDTVLGAKAVGGHVVGISPAISLKEHVAVFHPPYPKYDVLIYTGLGLVGRELINIHSSDIVIVVGGRSGTLGEFAIPRTIQAKWGAIDSCCNVLASPDWHYEAALN